MRAAVFLDRDNTIIDNDGDLGEPDQVRLLRGAASAIASLRGLGYSIVVVTNQSGVGRGKFTEQQVHEVHERINELVHDNCGVRIDRFYYCPHHPEARLKKYRRDHPWRKPQPGMILQAAADMALDLDRSWTVGDQVRDVEAGMAAGTRTILIDPNGALTAQTPAGVPERQVAIEAPDFLASDLVEAVKIVARYRDGDLSSELPADSDSTAGSAPIDPGPAAPGRIPAPSRPNGDPRRSDRPTPAQEPAGDERDRAEAELDAQVSEPVSEAVSEAESVAVSEAVPEEEPRQARGQGPGADPQPAILRQILNELRRGHRGSQELSPAKILAIVMQAVALICLLAAFWMSGADDGQFMRWLGCAILVQLATISMLLFQK